MGLVHHPNIVTDGLVCCWDGGNRRCGTPSAGGTWTGLGVNAPAILTNGTEFADISLGAILLDGTDEKVTVANTTDIDGQNGFTFGIWLYFLATPSNDYTCFSIYNGGGGYEFMLYIMDVSVHSKSIMLGTRGTNYSALRSDNTAMSPSNNIGKWVHYCATYNGDGANTPGNYKIYFNGQDMGSDGTTEFGGGTNTTRWGNDNGYGDLEGYIGRVAFYNRPLSADEVSQNYEATKPRFTPRITKSGLVGNWDAGDPASYPGGTTLKNTANGTAATFSNMNGSNFNSANGGYWDFDGTNEDINTNSKFNARTLGFTGTAWVKMTGDTNDNIFFWQNYVAQFRYDLADKLNFSEGLGTSWGGAQDILSAASLVADDTWVHVAAVYDSSDDGRKLYLNGAVVATDTSVITGSQATPSNNMYLGGLGGASSMYLDGSLAQVILYEGALSAAQIMDNFQKTRGRFGV